MLRHVWKPIPYQELTGATTTNAGVAVACGDAITPLKRHVCAIRKLDIELHVQRKRLVDQPFRVVGVLEDFDFVHPKQCDEFRSCDLLIGCITAAMFRLSSPAGAALSFTEAYYMSLKEPPSA